MRAHGETLVLFSLLILSPCLALSDTPPFSCDPSDPSTLNYAFCKTALPIEQRVQDLVSRLTVEEKIAQLGDVTPAIPRLGVPAYQWWSEALHGVAYGGRGSTNYDGVIKSATSFPQVILTGATFNPLLWYKIGQVHFICIDVFLFPFLPLFFGCILICTYLCYIY
jgi:hypothetical protein